ncbi:MAG: hypothetical protein JXD23_04710 [Spirochaetales bacterium]|nr:hypothetical protein [Spirochaetales bacterium]
MVKLARMSDPNYDLYARTGFPLNIPIPTINAARQITQDIIREGNLIDFVTHMIDVDTNGLMGKRTNFRFLSRIIKELDDFGYTYDERESTFVEKIDVKKTAYWGVLQEGKTYELTFLMFDIVKNSELVRRYEQEVITETYRHIRDIFFRNVEKRNGRVWSWEGDGGIAAFYFEDKNVKAVLSGVEIMLELFFYNMVKNPLHDRVQIRIAVHTGPCLFSSHMEKIESDTLRTLEMVSDEFTLPDTMTISPSVYSDMGSKLELFFKPFPLKNGKYLYRYQLEWEE